MRKYVFNNNGLTLLEIVLAFAILTIVVTFVLALFPQAAIFNQKTDQTLTAFNIAREKLVIIEQINKRSNKELNIDNKAFLISEGNKLEIRDLSRNYPPFSRLNLTSDVVDNEEKYVLTTEDGEYFTKLTFMKEPDTDSQSVIYLYKVYVEVEDNDGRVIRVYGYIQIPS